jgi:serine-threonine kinase receptor-associated protein
MLERSLHYLMARTLCDRVWDVRTKSVVRELETKSPCTSVEVSRDGNYITTADGNTVKFWDANQ